VLVGEFVRRATVEIRQVVVTGVPLPVEFHRQREDYVTVVRTDEWKEARQALAEKRARRLLAKRSALKALTKRRALHALAGRRAFQAVAKKRVRQEVAA
jgi:hypothetical protein